MEGADQSFDVGLELGDLFGVGSPELLDRVLTACCRAGYVTDISQPGHPPQPGRDGHQYTQRAFTTGFTTDPQMLARLTAAADAAGLIVVRTAPTGRGATAVPVPTRDGRPCAAVGRHLDEQNLRHQWEGHIGSEALDELLGAAQVSVVDPEWGSNRLWPVLLKSSAA
ncbi:hypothetical protein J7I94_24975 [Streptomyces sp. ISL-12]|uniref:DUF6919 domain-containing protein n=1 Tax=Streptomyces sp. ISL-12 TaxID=2819177 RepID=UPI001BEB7EB0|nr:hypothetical protein [Streptomyces sp. ISL-12]MBT2413766.1 hypothetical protein [Streptomyces sp. ISL-12]